MQILERFFYSGKNGSFASKGAYKLYIIYIIYNIVYKVKKSVILLLERGLIVALTVG